MKPPHPAALDVERDDGIGHRLRRVGVSVAGADVQRAATNVDGRRRPDAAAGGTPLLFARGVRAARLPLADGVGLPDDLPGAGVERAEAAAERAAFVLRPSALHFLVEALHRHEDTAVVVGGRPGDGGVWMLVDLADPDRTAARRVHRVRVGLQITEEDRPSGGAGRQAVWRDEERRADGGFRAERPVGASGPGVERMDVSAVAGDEQAVADERRLRACGRHVGVAKGPLQCQLRQVAGGQAAIAWRIVCSRCRCPTHSNHWPRQSRETAATTCRPRRTIPPACFAARARRETPRRRAGRRRCKGVPWIRILPFSSALRIASGLNCRSAATLGALAGWGPSAVPWHDAQFSPERLRTVLCDRLSGGAAARHRTATPASDHERPRIASTPPAGCATANFQPRRHEVSDDSERDLLMVLRAQ